MWNLSRIKGGSLHKLKSTLEFLWKMVHYPKPIMWFPNWSYTTLTPPHKKFHSSYQANIKYKFVSFFLGVIIIAFGFYLATLKGVGVNTGRLPDDISSKFVVYSFFVIFMIYFRPLLWGYLECYFCFGLYLI